MRLMRWEQKFKENVFILLLLLLLMLTACSSDAASNYEMADSTHTDISSFESKESMESGTVEEETQTEENTMKMKLEIKDHIFSVSLEENSSVDAFKELLTDGPLTLHMADYAGMEKGADLESVLPQNNEQMHTQAGDIILYQGKTLVIYYDTNSWSLTPIGKIENVNVNGLRKVLGTGDVTVTISIE